MPTYWDRLAQTHIKIGEAGVWIKHRPRITEGLSGQILEVCSGGGRLGFDLYQRDLDAYSFDPVRIARADVIRLPFADAMFDAVISTGAIALFKPEAQRAAVSELSRVARREIRLLESFEKLKGLYGGRTLAFMFDGMRPISLEVFYACGLDCTRVWDAFGNTFSYIRCQKRPCSVKN